MHICAYVYVHKTKNTNKKAFENEKYKKMQKKKHFMFTIFAIIINEGHLFK